MTKDGTWERLAKSAPWAQRERWAFKEKIAKKERRESLEEAPKIVWKIPSFRLGRVCPTLFPSTLHGYSVHAWGSVGCSFLRNCELMAFSLGVEKETGFL